MVPKTKMGFVCADICSALVTPSKSVQWWRMRAQSCDRIRPQLLCCQSHHPKTTVLYTAVPSVRQSNEVMPTIYFCHAINKGPGMLRAVLSSEEAASLLELRSAHYVGPLFPR